MTYTMQERDLDLILLEELHSDSRFDSWLAKAIGLKGHRCIKAVHSVSAKAEAKWGETDVLATFSDGLEHVVVLIEDKIAANFTDNQAIRYHERARELVGSGEANRYLTLLVAPAAYLAEVPADDPWDHRLSIEQLRDWFASFETSHAAWRASCLSLCIERVGRAKSAGSQEIRRFSEAFAAFLRRQPEGAFDHVVTGDSWGFLIRFPNKPAHVNLAWKPGRRCVDLTFSNYHVGKAQNVPSPVGVVRKLADNTNLKTDSFEVEVPMVDLSASFDDQADVVFEVTEAATKLLPLVREVLNSSNTPP